MTARAIILFLSSYIMYLSPLSAATKLSCSHPELCRMAEIILNENKVEGFSFETLVQIKGDPHEFEPTTNEVKELIKAPVLIAGPVELNPWIKKVNYQRSKIPGVKTINLPIEDADYALYPTANHEALSHFWLYPKIFCALKSDMESQFLKLGFLKAAPKNKSCKDEEIKITSSLKSTLENLKVPVVLTHDALLPLLESLGKNSAGVVAIKGSGHHEEASTASVKKLYDALKAPKVVWVLEDKINVPQNILAKKRSQDLTVNIDTGNSQGVEYFQTLMTLNDKLKALKP